MHVVTGYEISLIIDLAVDIHCNVCDLLLWVSCWRQYNIDDIIYERRLHDTIVVCGVGQRGRCINLM